MPSGTASSSKIIQEKRRRAVEDLYLAGYSALEIWDLLEASYKCARGTIRNDISAVRRRWKQDADATMEHENEGRHVYLASLRQLRRKVMEEDAPGRRDYNLAHKLDQEIARFSGVRLKSDERTLHLEIGAARAYVSRVVDLVFSLVTDPKLREQITEGLEKLATEDPDAGEETA